MLQACVKFEQFAPPCCGWTVIERFCVPPPHGREHAVQLDATHAIGQGCVLQVCVKAGQSAPPCCGCTVIERFCVPPPHSFEHAVQLDTAHAIGQC